MFIGNSHKRNMLSMASSSNNVSPLAGRSLEKIETNVKAKPTVNQKKVMFYPDISKMK